MIHIHAPSAFEARDVQVQTSPGRISFEPQFAGARAALAGYIQIDETVYRLEITPNRKLRASLLTPEPAPVGGDEQPEA